MNKDKLYINTTNKTETLDLPEYGNVMLVVQAGKIIRVDVTETTLFQRAQKSKKEVLN